MQCIVNPDDGSSNLKM